jgi:serine/threonine-protein kinase
MEKYCPQCFKRFPETETRCPEDDTRLVAVADDDLVGALIDDRYRIQDCIGKGGMGVVYRAKQTMIGRIVALKVLRKDVIQDESSVKRFMTEAKAMGDLKSAHTMTLHDFGVTSDGLLYYTMDFLDGRPLSKIVEQDGPMSIERTVDLMLQACDSLEEAHDHGILHRDIKPDNMFVTQRRGKEHVTVLDFGIAKLAGDVGADKITKTGMICGTPAYLSPEQVLYAKASPASDLYSLGIVFYECICGMAPFQDATPIGLLMKHVNEAVRPVSELNPKVTVPAAVDRFLVRALAKNPDQRFASIAEFRAAMLEACGSNTPSQLRVPVPAMATMDGGHRALNTTVPQSTPQGPPSGAPLADLAVAPERVVGSGSKGESSASGAGSKVGSAPPAEMASMEMAWSPAQGSSKWVKIGVVGGVLAVVLVGLLVWHPWKGSGGEGETGGQTSAGESGPSTGKEATSRGAGGRGETHAGTPLDAASALPPAGVQTDVLAEIASPDVVSAPPASDVTETAGTVDTPDGRTENPPEVVASPLHTEVVEALATAPDGVSEVSTEGDVVETAEATEGSPADRKGDRKDDRKGDRKGGRKGNGKDDGKGGTTSGKDNTKDTGTAKEPAEGAKRGDVTPKVPEEKAPEEKGLEFRKPTDGFRRPTVDKGTD